MSRPRLRIVVAGMVAADPYHGGATWAILQFVLGLRRLGHEVLLIDPVRDDVIGPASIEYFRAVMEEFELQGHAALLASGPRETIGLSYPDLKTACAAADLLLNISGLLHDEELLGLIRIRAYVDLDPAFTQLWHAAEGIDMHFGLHTHFVSVGLALGRASCPVPTCGVSWIITLPPVVLARWPASDVVEHGALTTVANWRGYGSIHHEGVHYGQKVHSLRGLITLPTRTDETFEIALDIHPDEHRDIDALLAYGWGLVSPREMAGTPDRYQRFIRGSRAEIGIAKSGYVVSRCGWFSDRSACYLASGRPVIAQDTGFGEMLPTGGGLLAFTDEEEALAAIEAVAGDYVTHARAARAIAEEHLDSDLVLRRLLEALL